MHHPGEIQLVITTCNYTEVPPLYTETDVKLLFSFPSFSSSPTAPTNIQDCCRPSMGRDGPEPIVGRRPLKLFATATSPWRFSSLPWPDGVMRLGNHLVRRGFRVMLQAMTTVAFVSMHDHNAVGMLSKWKSMLVAVILRIYTRTIESAQILKRVSQSLRSVAGDRDGTYKKPMANRITSRTFCLV